MDSVTLGRTGLQATVMGLGAGGPSRLGQATGRSEAESVAVVRAALDLGVNFIDTAEAYGTETIVGKALQGVPRDQFILSTKKGLRKGDHRNTPAEMAAGIDAALERLGVETIDVFHLHGVRDDDYDYAVAEIVPVLERARDQGKIRFLGITENFSAETTHAMLRRAVQDDCWDVMMVGFNLLNQTARTTIFPITQAKDIGVLIMFAVRRALSDPATLASTLRDLVVAGQVDPADLGDDPLGFVTASGAATSLTEAAYRYCRYEPGAHVILSGTGNVNHLRENAHALAQPPLPADVTARLNRLFAGVDSVAGN